MIPRVLNMDEGESHLVRRKGYLASWLILFTFSLGLFALWSREPDIVPVFMFIGYLALFICVGRTVIASRDIFNPLCGVLFVGFVRYCVPALLLLAGIEPSEGAARFFNLMNLSDSDWFWAHVLALTGLAGVALGWLIKGEGSSKPAWLHFSFAPGLSHAALLGMLVGLSAIAVFIAKNASLGAIVTGAVRGATVQEGTGIYQRLGFMLIAGSILLSAYLLERNKRRIALIPVIVATLGLGVLGGRGTALTPLLAGLLLQWYCNREQKGWPSFSFKVKHAFTAVPAILLAIWFFNFVGLYRGGYGLSALAESLSLEGIWRYVQHSVFAEFGSLHSLAGAVAIGPGVLEGKTFLGSLTFPLPKFLPIPGRSGGIFIIETLVGSDPERRWGLHASLIGDAFLNFGVSGILLVMPLFGMLLKALYLKFRQGTLNAAVYAFAAVYSVSLFQKSIDAWPNMLVGMIFMVAIIRIAEFFSFRQRAFA